MAEICLRYRLMEDLEDDEGQSSSSKRDFLQYSAMDWSKHVQKMSLIVNHEVFNRVHRMCYMGGKRTLLWFPIFWRAVMLYRPMPSMNALNLAAFDGHGQEFHYLLSVKKHNIDTADDTETAPFI